MKRRFPSPFRELHGWWLLVLAALAGMAVGGAATLWLPGPAAVSLGSAIAVAFFTATSARAKTVLEKHASRRDERPTKMVAAGIGGRPLRVRDLDDPIMLRVHPAEALVREIAGTPVLDRTPPYVHRDLHDELEALIRRGGLVLVLGESTAGKTRAAYEAIRAACPDHILLAPANRDALADVARIALDTHQCVLWLDDLERFIGAGGLTPNLINRLLARQRGHLVLAATMRSPEYDRYSAREEDRNTGADLDAWRDARDVRRLAGVVELSRRWTAGEIARARGHDDDPRIRAALSNVERFGLAEVLAAGPELVRNWNNAWSPGARPRGAALVAAAVDCRRAGMDDPVPLSLLTKLSQHYLNERGGELLRPESQEVAVAWATETSHGASSLLLPCEKAGYLIAFDYLVDQPGLELVPPLTWQTLLDHVDPRQIFRIGEAAARRFQHAIAAHAFSRAAAYNVPGADLAAEFYATYGDQINTNSSLERLLESRLAKYGSKHPETLQVRLTLAESLADSPHSGKSLDLFPELVRDLTEVLGDNHQDVLDARRWYAYAVGVCGDPETAIKLLNETCSAHEKIFGTRHISTLLLHHYLAFFTAEADPHTALGMLETMQEKYSIAYGKDSPRVLQILYCEPPPRDEQHRVGTHPPQRADPGLDR